METQTKQTIEQRINAANQTVLNAKRELAIAEKEAARIEIQRNKYEKFQELISASDLCNRYKSNGHRYNLESSSAIEEDKVKLLLEECRLEYCLPSQGLFDKFSLACNYQDKIHSRTMNQETYESILNGTEATLGKYIQTIINPKKVTLLGRLFGGKK